MNRRFERDEVSPAGIGLGNRSGLGRVGFKPLAPNGLAQYNWRVVGYGDPTPVSVSAWIEVDPSEEEALTSTIEELHATDERNAPPDDGQVTKLIRSFGAAHVSEREFGEQIKFWMETYTGKKEDPKPKV